MIKNDNGYNQLPDEELFLMVKNDDKRAFNEIYERYRMMLKDKAEKMLDSPQLAEDIVQELFLNLYNRRYQIDIQVSLRSYLSKAIKFRILNEFRSSGVRTSYQKEMNTRHASTISENNCYDFEVKDLNYSIQCSIDALPDKCKTAFLLSRTEQLSYKDISGFMGISVSTVEKHISKALKVLKSNPRISDFSTN
ncbi:RNA polymerase sigma-70 factor [Niabella insulamsoli]|uniref:RNA polymerase sigma-70 factor n=1 Tax=Niabella insulamsoli TaxID=3144874 RepID=UPI0031FD24CF